MMFIKMRSRLLILLVIISLLVVGVAAANSNQNEGPRFLVKSNNVVLKAGLGVIHSFDNGFTTHLTNGKKAALERLGVEAEEVPQYKIVGKPVCGDGVCQGNEAKTCPLDCSGGTDPAPERSCTPTVQKPYGIVMINGSTGGAGVNVAVLDTGVKKDHLDLDVKLCKDTTKRGIKNGCSDGNGHGTHVAGTIAANGGADGLGIYGVAPEANLWMIKVCGNSGLCWTDDMAIGIRYAADQGVNVISMSIGGDTQSSLVKNAIDYAVGKGVLIVAAAGNDGPADGSIDYPGANSKVIAVGAVDANKAVPSWSSRGVNDGDYVVEEKEVEFGAPGVSVESTWNNGCYNTISGTSMATPHVSGLAAKLWQGNSADTRTYLQQLAKNNDLHVAGDDTATGFGLPAALN